MSAHAELVILRHEVKSARERAESEHAYAQKLAARLNESRDECDKLHRECEQLRKDNLELAKRLQLIKTP